MQFGRRLANDADDVQVPLERFLVMQAADDVDFCRTLLMCFLHALPNHVVGEGVCLLVAQVGSKGAKLTTINADVGGVQVDVGVVVGNVAVFSLANDVRQPAEGEQVGLFVEKDALFE